MGRMFTGHIDKENYYLDIAQTMAGHSIYLHRYYGTTLVKSDEIISTGYNGAPHGRHNCVDLNYCTREALSIPSGERYELCHSIHAEANVIISVVRNETLGVTLYMTCVESKSGALIPGSTSCFICRRLIINADIARVVIRDTRTEYRVVDVADQVREDDSLPRSLWDAGPQKLISSGNVLGRGPPQT